MAPYNDPPRPLLLIFDLNGVLVDMRGKKRFTLRPGVDDMLNMLSEQTRQSSISIAFWTSRPECNGRPVFEAILPRGLEPLFIWYRDACTPITIDGNPYHTVKDLNKVWRAFPQFSAENTLLIDDTPTKCQTHPDNLVLVDQSPQGIDGTAHMCRLIADRVNALINT